jgi:hypothetical protein
MAGVPAPAEHGVQLLSRLLAGAGGRDRELESSTRGAHLPDKGGLPHIQGDAVRGHFQQGKIDDGTVNDRSVADAGDADEALFGIEDAPRCVEVGTGDGVNRGPVDPPQTLRFFDAVGGGDSSTAAIEHLINQQVDQRRGMFRGHVDGADIALRFGADVPHLPGRPGLLHGGQHSVGGLRHPVGVGHARGFCGGGQCRRDNRGDSAAATEHLGGFGHPGAALLGE